MRTSLIVTLALLWPAVLFQLSCSSTVALTEEGEDTDALLIEMDEEEGVDIGVDVSEAVPDAADQDPEAEAEQGGAPATRMRVGITLEEALDRYYQTLTNYTLSFFVMAQEAFAINDLTRAVHLAERSAELLPNEQVFIFKAYLFEIMDNYERALRALENVDLDRAGLQTYRQNLALDQSRREAVGRESASIPVFMRPVDRAVRKESVASGYYVRLASMPTKPDAQTAFDDIADYFAIAFENEPFAGGVYADQDVFLGRQRDRVDEATTSMSASDEPREDVPADTLAGEDNIDEDSADSGPFSVLVGPYPSRAEATVAFSRLIFFHPIIELVERR